MKKTYPYRPPSSDGTDVMVSLSIALVILTILIIFYNLQ